MAQASRGPHCPECKQVGPTVLGFPRPVVADGNTVWVVVVYCATCGCILGAVRANP